MKVQRGEQEKGRTEETDKLLETADKKTGRQKKAGEHVRERARCCRMRSFSLSLFCVACLCRLLAGWHVYSPGGTVNLPERHQSQKATTGG